MGPRTKHINTKYHHFRQQVQESKIVIEAIGTEDSMLADISTKVVNEDTLKRLRPHIMGW
jgi:GH35 family endo-1,4-beta-xylanase